MTKRKQCAALALALTLTISMFGCEKDKETTQSSAVSQIKTSELSSTKQCEGQGIQISGVSE